MDITMVIGGLSGGGAERVVCNLSNYLNQQGHNITILTMSMDKSAYPLNKEIKRISLYNNSEDRGIMSKNIKRIIRLRKYIKQTQTEAYVVMLPVTINLLLSLRSLIKVPIIVSERGDPATREKNSKIQGLFMRKLYPKADNFVFQTIDAKKFYNSIIGKKGEIIPNAINEEFIRPAFEGIRNKKIVSVGRFNEQKNFKMLIEAFSKIEDKYPEYTLEIFGEGKLRDELNGYIHQLGLESRVSLPGYVNNIANKIEESSLFVLPSNFEGMPNALMESMALGVPSISTDCPVGGPRYLIDDGENGFLVPVGDVEELALKMDEVLSKPDLASSFSRKSRAIVNKLKPEVIYGSWEKLIKETIDCFNGIK